jgi:hypothetical protein
MGQQSLAELAESIKGYWEPSGFSMLETERRSEAHATPVAH